MHELSIAENIIDIIRQHVEPDRFPDVRSVCVSLGTYSGIVPESLEFSFQALTAGTLLERSFLTFEHIPFVVKCMDCGRESVREDGAAQCGECGGCNTKIISGQELHMKDIELEDEPAGMQ